MTFKYVIINQYYYKLHPNIIIEHNLDKQLCKSKFVTKLYVCNIINFSIEERKAES